MSEQDKAGQLQKVRAIFECALEYADAEERSDYLHGACGDDPETRLEIDRLLRNHHQIEEWISEALPRFGPYQATRQIGRGGMGIVYEAQRADGQYDRRVAIKVLAAATLDGELRKDMLRERQILAGLSHPGIAQLFDGGTTEAGDPYLVVEYIDGEHLDVYCDQQKLSPAQRLELFGRVLDAIEYAHNNGVAHRDLKPSNILVNADGQPKVLDFGTAQLAQSEAGEPSRCYTPEYGSPEMAAGQAADARSDIYSLGLIYKNILREHARPEVVNRARQATPELRFPDVAAMRQSAFARKWPKWPLAAVATVAALGWAAWHWATKPPVLRPITSSAASWKDAVVSWDGSTLAFTAGDGTAEGRDIWTSGPNGENAKSLFADQTRDDDPTLSPDGRFVAFRSATEPAGIHEFDRQTGTRRPLVPGGYRPLYSPDGKWLLYATGDDRDDPSRASKASWAVVPARGGSPVPVGGPLRHIHAVLWSANGASILFQANEQLMMGYNQVWRYRLDQRQAGPPLELAAELAVKDWAQAGLTICAVEPKDDSLLAISISSPPALMRISLPNPARLQMLTVLPDGTTNCRADRLGGIYLTRQRLATRHFWVPPTAPDGAPRQPTETFLPQVPGFDQEEPWSVMSASQDGRVVAYYSSKQRQNVILATPQGVLPIKHQTPLLSGDGRFVWFHPGGDPSSVGRASVTRPQIPLTEFPVRALPWGVSSDGSKLFATVHPSVPRAISVIDNNSRVNLLYRHKQWNLYRAKPSPDDRWVAFTAHDTAHGLRVFVAPFRDQQAVPDTEWIEIGEGTSGNFSPDGDRIYFASERDGHWCLYQRDLDAATKRPKGPVRPLAHLHGDFTAAQLPHSSFNLTSSGDGLRFSLGRMSHRVFRLD